MDITDITPLDINRKLKSIEADLDYYLNKKMKAFDGTQPKAVCYDKELVQGGRRENLFDKYIMTNEELDPIINLLQEEKQQLNLLLEKKLRASGEYAIILQTLIGLKERGYSWARIDKEYVATNKIYASIGTCRNIWKKHVGKRTV